MEELRSRFSQLDTLVTQGVDGSNVQTIIGGMRDFIKLMLEEQVSQHQLTGDMLTDIATVKLTRQSDDQTVKTHDAQITKLEQPVSAHGTLMETADNCVKGLESRIIALESSSSLAGAAMSSVAAINTKVDQLAAQQVSASDIRKYIRTYTHI